MSIFLMYERRVTNWCCEVRKRPKEMYAPTDYTIQFTVSIYFKKYNASPTGFESAKDSISYLSDISCSSVGSIMVRFEDSLG